MRTSALIYAVILTLFGCTVYLYYSNRQQQEDYVTEIFSVTNYNVWVMFVRISTGNTRTTVNNFHRLVENVLKMSSVPISWHIIVDNSSKDTVLNEIRIFKVKNYKLYDLDECKKKIQDIADVLMPHLSRNSDLYFRDSMFYISLGLQRIAPETQKRAIMLDCDLVFRRDVRLLFEEFERFKPGALFGMGFELSPLYHQLTASYRKSHEHTTFGAYYHEDEILSESQPHPRGFPGYNSGVVLFDFDAIRQSEQYRRLFEAKSVSDLFKKYSFRGFSGDQDFYTLIGYEYPDLIQTLNCGCNRQLCQMLKKKSYLEVFDFYFKCEQPIVVYHGNCKSPIPSE